MMERNSVNSSGLEWEDLSVPKFDVMSHHLRNVESSIVVGCGKLGHNCSNSMACEPMTGLRLGRQREYGDNTDSTMSSVPAKRSRASFQSMQNPCCQVEGCKLDLKLAKDYHRRHRICETHSKSPNVIVAGMERRFCQQCSRFHELSEFDDKKRSCRKRLSDHNARRRRVQPVSIQLASARPPPAIHEQRPHNILLNGLPVSFSNSSWEYANMFRPSKVNWGLESTVCFSTDDVHNSISSMHMDSDSRLSSMQSSPVLDQYLLTAHSLLSPNSWSLNEGESSSIEGLVLHDNYMRHTESEAQNLSFIGGGGEASINMHKGGSSSQSEFQPFKAHYDSDAFYSTQRDL